MPPPPSSLRAFLATAKKSLAAALAHDTPVNLVVGNESADLDSITSSIVYSYLSAARAGSSGGASDLYLPLVNIPRDDIRIRPELLALLPHANIEPEHLITLSDLPLGGSRPARVARCILVDHNVLQGPLGKAYADRVTGCIDHHVDEGVVPKDHTEPRIVTTSGSCTSLVVNYFRDNWDTLSGSASSSSTAQGQGDAAVGQDDAQVRATWDAQVAKLALASILVDTTNLKSKDKVTEHDTAAANYLKAKILRAPKNAAFQTSDFFREVSSAKKNLDGLSLADILRKDYKQWTEGDLVLGMASVVKPLAYLASRGNLEAELDAFARDRKLSLLTVMTTSTDGDGQFRRELLLRATGAAAAGVAETFADKGGAQLKLQEEQLAAAGAGARVWRQGELAASRKQVAPLLRAALRDVNQTGHKAQLS